MDGPRHCAARAPAGAGIGGGGGWCRRFRGVWYEIAVRREGPGNTVALTVDGRAADGDVVPLPSPGIERVVVKVRLGA